MAVGLPHLPHPERAKAPYLPQPWSMFLPPHGIFRLLQRWVKGRSNQSNGFKPRKAEELDRCMRQADRYTRYTPSFQGQDCGVEIEMGVSSQVEETGTRLPPTPAPSPHPHPTLPHPCLFSQLSTEQARSWSEQVWVVCAAWRVGQGPSFSSEAHSLIIY